MVSENGSWTYGESQHGVYSQHAGLLDMSGDVVLYRDDGVTLRTQSAAMDLKQGRRPATSRPMPKGRSARWTRRVSRWWTRAT